MAILDPPIISNWDNLVFKYLFSSLYIKVCGCIKAFWKSASHCRAK